MTVPAFISCEKFIVLISFLKKKCYCHFLCSIQCHVAVKLKCIPYCLSEAFLFHLCDASAPAMSAQNLSLVVSGIPSFIVVLTLWRTFCGEALFTTCAFVPCFAAALACLSKTMQSNLDSVYLAHMQLHLSCMDSCAVWEDGKHATR